MADLIREMVSTESKEFVIGKDPILVTTPKTSVQEYLKTNPAAEDLEIATWRLDEILQEHQETHSSDTTSARLAIAKTAENVTRYPADFDEILTPDALGLTLSIENELLVKNKLSFTALAEGSITPEILLHDYFSALHIITANKLIGQSSYNNQQLFKDLDTKQREQIIPFFVQLSHYTPNISESVENITSLLEKRLESIKNFPLLVEEIEKQTAKLLSQGRNEGRNKWLVDEIQKFRYIKSLSTSSLHTLILDPFSGLGRAIRDSKFMKTNETDNNENTLRPLLPSWSQLNSESREEQYKSAHLEIQEFLIAFPKLAELASTYIQSAREDAISIGKIIDRRPSETDEQYSSRLKQLTELDLTNEQREFRNFVKEGLDSGEFGKDPEILLRKISEICGIQLIHAETTPTQTIVNELAANAALQGYINTGEDRVFKMQTEEEVMKKRVLISVPERNMGYEWHYLQANLKSAVPLNETPDFIQKNGPINVLTLEQNDKFEKLMEVVRLEY